MCIDDIMKELSKNQGGQINLRELGEIMTNDAAFLPGKPAASYAGEVETWPTMAALPSDKHRNRGQLKMPSEESQNQGDNS